MVRTRVFVVAAVVVLVVAIGAVALVATRGGDGGDRAASGPPPSVTVRLETTSVLDWQTRMTSGALRMANPAYERLVIRSDATNEVVPYLAQSWTQEPAAPAAPTTITFTLKKGPTCANGDPVTPTVVKDSFQRLIEVKKQADETPNLFGPGPYTLSADDAAGTFTFQTAVPWRNLLAGFATAGVICPEGLKAVQADPTALQKAQFGSGPYVLSELKQEDQAVWTLRPEWNWGPDGGTAADLPAKLVYKVVVDQTTSANLLLSGGQDVADVAGPSVDRLLAEDSLVQEPNKSYEAMTLQMNQRPDRITADRDVRRAIMTAVDSQKFNQAAFNGRGTVTGSLIRDGVACYDASVEALRPQADAAAARQILTAAGWAPNAAGALEKDGRPLRIDLLTSTAAHGAGGEYLAQALTDAGFAVTLDAVASAQYSPGFVEGKWDVSLSAGFSPVPNPGQRWTQFVGSAPPGGSNFGATGEGNAEWTSLYREAMTTGGPESCATFTRMQQVMYRDALILPLVFPDSVTFGTGTVAFPANVLQFEPVFLRPGTRSAG